jgi:hypothetical protein
MNSQAHLEAQVRALRAALDPFNENAAPPAPEPPQQLQPRAARQLSECDLVLEHFPEEDMVEARVAGRVLCRVPRLQHALGASINVYRNIAAGGVRPTHVGILGDVGEAQFGDGWHAQSPRTVAGNCDFTLHGMNETAAAIIGWGADYGNVERLEASRLRLYGSTDSFVIRANEDAGWILMNNCVLDPGPHQEPYGGRASFMHWDRILGLCIQDCRTLEGSRCTESIIYCKSIKQGGLFILRNTFRGANRNVIHIRPEQGHNLVPDGPVVIKGNDFRDHGRAWGPQDGGAVINVYASPEHCAHVEDNDCRNSEYGGILISGDQDPPSRQFPGYDWQIKQAVYRRNLTAGAERFEFQVDNIGELWTDVRPLIRTIYGPSYGVGVMRRTS